MHQHVGRLLAGVAVLAGLGLVAPAATQAAARVEIGVLNCQASGSVGFIVGSTRTLSCTFKRADGSRERYSGTINKIGLDIGYTSRAAIVWAVFAPTGSVPPGALEGGYGGLSAEATIGVGLGANALLGGFKKSIALQPLSVQGQEGLNIAAGVSSLTLTAR